tara:strand:+ start:502 stop:747 length:246 start_codon:yes stop_codon:yes gene_type:complete
LWEAAMKLESSRKADELNSRNMENIQKLINEFESPNTSQTRRLQLKEVFREIIAHVDKVQQQDSLFFRMAKKVSDNGKKGE